MGIVFGDGGINNNWQLVVSLSAIRDNEYSLYVVNLIEKLFKITVVVRKRPNQNTLVLVSSSTDLVDFLVEKGAIRGNKVLQSINIPLWIKKNRLYKLAFVRGLVDTDGCLYSHKHTIKKRQYVHIGLCFTSFLEN